LNFLKIHHQNLKPQKSYRRQSINFTRANFNLKLNISWGRSLKLFLSGKPKDLNISKINLIYDN